MEDSILIEAQNLKEWKDKKRQYEALVKEANEQISEIESKLIDSMIDFEVDSFVSNGVKFSLQITKYPKVREGQKEEFITNLYSDNELRNLLSVNAQTLKAFSKEQIESNDGEIPSWLEKYLEFYDKKSISVRGGK